MGSLLGYCFLLDLFIWQRLLEFDDFLAWLGRGPRGLVLSQELDDLIA